MAGQRKKDRGKGRESERQRVIEGKGEREHTAPVCIGGKCFSHDQGFGCRRPEGGDEDLVLTALSEVFSVTQRSETHVLACHSPH